MPQGDTRVSKTTLFTIGFTKKTAEKFFEKLKRAGVQNIVDVRLNNVSQLAGFAKRADLEYFLRELAGIGYIHVPELAPTKEMFDAFKKNKGDWSDFKKPFLDLMHQRRIEEVLDRNLFDRGCLLCSEDKPHHCHRSLVARYLNEKWNGISVDHL